MIKGQVPLSKHTQILELDPCLEHEVQLILSPFKNPGISASAIGYYNYDHTINYLYSGMFKEEILDKICLKTINNLDIPKVPRPLINCILNNGEYNQSGVMEGDNVNITFTISHPQGKDAILKSVAKVKKITWCTNESSNIITNLSILSTQTENQTTTKKAITISIISEYSSTVPTTSEKFSNVSTISENHKSVSIITENPGTVSTTQQTNTNIPLARSPEKRDNLAVALVPTLISVLLLASSGLLGLVWRRRRRENQMRGKTGCL